MNLNKRVLVLGASGGIGGEVARRMRDAGWEVRSLQRNLATPNERRDGITRLRGDAMVRADVLHAARGCAVIVHAVNPPGYRRWAELVLPMIDNTIAAATAEQALIVLPGTIYNFGPDAFPVLTEGSAQRPTTAKGAIRVELERRLMRATTAGARALIVRAGDFFGPQARQNWFAMGLIAAGKPVAAIRNPARRGTGHQWSYVPDVARTMLALIDRREGLEPFAVFHTRGHWDPDGTRMAETIARAVERRAGRRPRITKFPWWLLPLLSPFVTMFRETAEMRYLWNEPLRMTNEPLVRALGAEPHTEWDAAVEATLVGLGCMTDGPRQPSVSLARSLARRKARV